MIEDLQRLGLTPKEALIYETLVKLGPSPATQIAKLTKTNRSVTYNVLQQLCKKGIVTHVEKQGMRVYSLASPESLLAIAEEKRLIAKEIISQVLKTSPHPVIPQTAQIYEGVAGLHSAFREISQVKELKVLNATGQIFESLPYAGKHLVDFQAKNTNVMVIACDSARQSELAKYPQFKVKYMPPYSNNIATTFIYEDNILIQILDKPIFIVKIKSQHIADGYEQMFSLLWECLAA